MRRFVDTIAGKAFCHLAAMALVLPTVTLAVTSRAEAQVQQLPSWAITEFKDLKNPSSKYGTAAADAIAGELAKTNRYDVVSQETVKRSIETLGLSSPPEGLVNLSRIGQDVRASTIVAGEVVDYRINQVGGGKQAVVAVRAVAYDAASAVPVNGALERGESTIRSGNVTDEALVSDAINQAAALAVRTMQGQQLPTATVLNTTPFKALINQGSRSGFKGGDTVLITRGPIQVGTGRINNVEFDQAELTPERNSVGIAPGDKVRTVFTPPALPVGRSVFTKNGEGINRPSTNRRKSNNATLISALLVVGLIAVLLSSGNSNKQTVTSSVEARANYSFGVPGVHIHWSQNAFAGGNQQQAAWQVYRSDNLSTPIVVTSGDARDADDTANGPIGGGLTTYTPPYQNPRPSTCVNTSYGGATFTPTTFEVGRSYTYSVELVYRITNIDLPGGDTGDSTSTSTSTATTGTTSTSTTTGSTSTTTGTTATTGTTGTTSTTSTTSTTGTTSTSTTTGTTSTSTTTGTTSTGGTLDCYGMSTRSSSGIVTPITRPTISTSNTSIAPTLDTVFFDISSVRGANSTSDIDYVIEFSARQSFDKGYTVRTPVYTRNNFSAFTIQIATLSNSLFTDSTAGKRVRNAIPVYFRVGARSHNDAKSPVSNAGNGGGYIYSEYSTYSRTALPPSAP